MSALRLTIFCTPIASEMVTTAGKASGTTATARAMPKMSISMKGCPRTNPKRDDDGNHHKAALCQGRADLIQILLERGLARFQLSAAVGRSCQTRSACRWRQRPPLPAPVGGGRAGIDHVLAVANWQVVAGKGGSQLFDRKRFARQRGFLHLQIDRFESGAHPRESGLRYAAGSRRPGPGHGPGFPSPSRPDGAGCQRRHFLQRFDRVFRPVLLDKPQQHRKEHDHGNRDQLHAVS